MDLGKQGNLRSAVSRHDGPPEFLITAGQAFPAIEDLILDAQNTLDISLHVFSPRTKTRNQRSHERRLVDWSDLLIDAVSRGVNIRILVNDFDPVGMNAMHTNTWERAHLLADKLKNADAELKGSIELVLGLPGGQSGFLIRAAIWPIVRYIAEKSEADLSDQERIISPRLRKVVRRGRVRFFPPARNYTQAFHQKFFIADNRVAILGGLDIDERRFDDTDHQVPAPETWHDVNVKFGDRSVFQLSKHFEFSFKRANNDGYTIIQLGQDKPEALAGSDREEAKNNTGKVVVTAGKLSSSPLAFGPAPDLVEIETATIELVKSAQYYIYIESQYFRSSAIRDALIEAANQNPELRLIILLPAAPDVVAFDGHDSPVHRYGEWLQMRALNRVKKAFGSRMGVFCLTSNVKREEQVERDALHGHSVVYVHSKLIIRDDCEALISSANMNGRSMQWDFEAGYITTEEEAVVDLREQLWLAHLGPKARDLSPNTAANEALEKWSQSASSWKNGQPEDRLCGVVPFPMEKTKRFAKRHLFIPENMV